MSRNVLVLCFVLTIQINAHLTTIDNEYYTEEDCKEIWQNAVIFVVQL